jgi:SET domain-containing protein
MNHLCKPNCVLEQWCIDGLPHMCFFANKDMTRGEELVFHYNWELAVKDVEEFNEKVTKCKCGTQHCKGLIKKMILGKTTKPGGRKRKR